MKNPNYGEDIVGWLSYITHKKETMDYINYLEKELKEKNKIISSLESKNKELKSKLRVKRKNDNGKIKVKKKTNKIARR